MKYTLLIILFFMVLLTMYSAQIQADIIDGIGDKPEGLKEKDVTDKKLPSFNLLNLADDEVLLEDLRDENLVILMFSSKCPYSKNSGKLLDELLKDNKDVKLLAICLDGDIGDEVDGGKTQKHAAEEFSVKCFKNVKNFEVLLADENFRSEYSRFFGTGKLQKTPIHLFADGNARVKLYIKGSSDKEELKDALASLSE
ncbi:MAG: redoxin domain-containing protein [Planctomycetes bacterium]|nr:redoxin domain-containing protein [Planctomycetota bacterium]